jgi:hypothetical protein
MSYCQRDTGIPSDFTSNANRSAVQSVTVDVVGQTRQPRLLTPRKRAPTDGPDVPSHLPPAYSSATPLSLADR